MLPDSEMLNPQLGLLSTIGFFLYLGVCCNIFGLVYVYCLIYCHKLMNLATVVKSNIQPTVYTVRTSDIYWKQINLTHSKIVELLIKSYASFLAITRDPLKNVCCILVILDHAMFNH